MTFALSGEDILGINGELTYDSSLVTLTGMESSAVSQWTAEFNGGVFLAYDSSLSLPISGETLLFTASFEVNADAPVGSVITVSCADIVAYDDEQDIHVATADYSARVDRKSVV